MATRLNYNPTGNNNGNNGNENERENDKYIVFYCSKFCKNSVEIIDFIKKNVDKLNKCQMIQLLDIADLIESGNNVPSYIKFIPAITICDSETNSIQSEDDIIFGSNNVIKCMNSVICKNVKKSSYSIDNKTGGVDRNNMHRIKNSDWTKNIVEVNSKKDAPISTNIFAEKYENKKMEKKIDYNDMMKERAAFNEELGKKESEPKDNTILNNTKTKNKEKRRIAPSNNAGGLTTIKRK
jgi:hypothetical protein